MRYSRCVVTAADAMQPFPVPDRGQSNYACGCAALQKRDLLAAVDSFYRAERSGFEPDLCAAGRWQCYMLLGRFEQAWRESAAIEQRGKPDPHRLWDGKPFSDRRVMVRCLHGLGDAIQFIRFASPLRQYASKVIVESPRRLMPLLTRVPGVDEVCTWEGLPSAPSDWDQQMEIVELPRAFRTTLDTIPASVPYIHLERLTQWSGISDERPRVGVVWASGGWDRSRSIPVSELTPIFQLRDIRVYALQGGAEAADLNMLPANCMVHDVTGESEDLLGAAKLIAQFDLILTVDTMVAHLAGALAKPVWLMLNFAADWRWMTGRSDSPWYPTMRIFRQPRPGRWDCVAEQVCSALVEWVRTTGQRSNSTAMLLM